MKLFVGNLSFRATEEAVRFMFETHGKVESVSIMTDRDTLRSRGFGFVEMPNGAEPRELSRLSVAESFTPGASPSTKPARKWSVDSVTVLSVRTAVTLGEARW
jgi:hypothetical protein